MDILDTKTINDAGNLQNCSNMTEVSGCERPSGHFIYKEPVIQHVNGSLLTLLSLIAHLKWTSVCVIYDKQTGK